MLKHRSTKLILFFLLLALIAIAIYSASSDPEKRYTVNNIEEGYLEITRVIVTDSKKETELGMQSDWLEIKNTTDREIHLKAGEWYLTDKGFDRPFRFPLPEVFISPKKKLRIWCDGQDMHGKEIHTNFKLDADGEHVAIFVKTADGVTKTIDIFEYDEAEDSRGFKKKDGEKEPLK